MIRGVTPVSDKSHLHLASERLTVGRRLAAMPQEGEVKAPVVGVDAGGCSIEMPRQGGERRRGRYRRSRRSRAGLGGVVARRSGSDLGNAELRTDRG